MTALARGLQRWAGFLLRQVQAGERRAHAPGLAESGAREDGWPEHAPPEGAPGERRLPSADQAPATGVVEATAETGPLGAPPAHWLERVRSSGPPAHWLEHVRQSAPELAEELEDQGSEALGPYPAVPTAGPAEVPAAGPAPVTRAPEPPRGAVRSSQTQEPGSAVTGASTASGEQGAGSGEQGAGSGEQGAGSGEQGAGRGQARIANRESRIVGAAGRGRPERQTSKGAAGAPRQKEGGEAGTAQGSGLAGPVGRGTRRAPSQETAGTGQEAREGPAGAGAHGVRPEPHETGVDQPVGAAPSLRSGQALRGRPQGQGVGANPVFAQSDEREGVGGSQDTGGPVTASQVFAHDEEHAHEAVPPVERQRGGTQPGTPSPFRRVRAVRAVQGGPLQPGATPMSAGPESAGWSEAALPRVEPTARSRPGWIESRRGMADRGRAEAWPGGPYGREAGPERPARRTAVAFEQLLPAGTGVAPRGAGAAERWEPFALRSASEHPWPPLPPVEEPPGAELDEWRAAVRAWERLQRLDREQRGAPWNA